MNLYHIAFKNLIRRKARMMLIVCGLASGITAAVALFMIVEAMRRDLGDQIDEFGSNLVVVPRAAGMDISYGGTHVSRVSLDLEQLREADLEKIKEIPDYDSINVVSPKMVAAVKAGDRDALLVGILPEREFIMKPWFSLSERDGRLPGAKTAGLALLELPEDGLLAGARAALSMDIAAGDTLSINGNPFRVAGILTPLGTVEDGLLFGNLPAVQSLLDRAGEISMVEISAYCNACPVEEIAAQLGEALPNGRVTALRQSALLRKETIDRFSAFSTVLAGVILVIAGLMVLTTVMSSVHERTREIGIFRAIGFRGAHVAQIIFVEGAAVGLSGGLAGYLLGSLAAGLAGPYLGGISGPIPWQAELLLPALLLGVIIPVAASAFPAHRAARMDPAEAMRFI